MAMTTLTKTRVLLTALTAAAAFLSLGAGSAAAAHDASQATANCWLQVVNDWEDNGRVDNTYAPPCYTQAIQHLNAYPDLKGYSSAIDDIQRAELAAIHQERGDGGSGFNGGPSNGGHNGGTAPPGSGPGGNGPNPPGGNSSGGGHNASQPFGNAASATSIPLPLIVLGALAILLALAALGTWLARRYQGRRPAPAPAISRRR